MRIDDPAHAQPPEYLDALLASGRYEVGRDETGQIVLHERGARFLTMTPQMHDPAARVAEMDAAGIDLQILSVTTPQVYFLEGPAAVDLARRCNDYPAGLVQAYPHRFRALASVPLTADSDAAIAEFSRCMDELGMDGAIIGANIAGRPLDDPAFDPFYAEASRRGTVLFIHPMVPAGIETMNAYALAPLVGFMFDTTLAVARLIFADFFGRFPDIRLLAGHLGATLPYLAGRLDIGWRSYADCQGLDHPPSADIQQLYLDTVSFHPPALRCALETVGPDRILFGSDYPHVIGDVPGAIASIETTAPAEAQTGILGSNAARLFAIPDATGAGEIELLRSKGEGEQGRDLHIEATPGITLIGTVVQLAILHAGIELAGPVKRGHQGVRHHRERLRQPAVERLPRGITLLAIDERLGIAPPVVCVAGAEGGRDVPEVGVSRVNREAPDVVEIHPLVDLLPGRAGVGAHGHAPAGRLVDPLGGGRMGQDRVGVVVRARLAVLPGAPAIGTAHYAAQFNPSEEEIGIGPGERDPAHV